MNNYQYGGRSTAVLLPGESVEDHEALVQRYIHQLGAVTEPEQFQARTAADFTHIYNRAQTACSQAITQHQDAFEKALRDRDAGVADNLLPNLRKDPPGHLRLLRKSSVGCRALIGHWQSLRDGITTHGRFDDFERRRGLALMGQRPDAVFLDPAVTHWTSASCSATFGNTDDSHDAPLPAPGGGGRPDPGTPRSSSSGSTP